MIYLVLKSKSKARANYSAGACTGHRKSQTQLKALPTLRTTEYGDSPGCG